jgi:hypothetical protein
MFGSKHERCDCHERQPSGKHSERNSTPQTNAPESFLDGGRNRVAIYIFSVQARALHVLINVY